MIFLSELKAIQQRQMAMKIFFTRPCISFSSEFSPNAAAAKLVYTHAMLLFLAPLAEGQQA